MRCRTLLCSLAVLIGLLGALPVQAVIIASGDGTGNTTAPPDDPGWSYLAIMGGLSAVYLGDGWMLTAAHAPLGTLDLMGTLYDPIVGTETQISNPDSSLADLLVFAIHGFPNLPLLPIRTTTPPISTGVIMGGKGLDRGASTTCNPPGPGGPSSGYLWAATANKRWGTNVVDGYPTLVDSNNTFAFSMAFDSGLPTAHEAQAAVGDSGGAVWVKNGATWELAGLLFNTLSCEFGKAVYGDETFAADLSVYRDEILDIVALPEPGAATGLAAGASFLLLLGRRRIRR